MTEVSDPLDEEALCPSEAFRQHHEVVGRTGGVGFRVSKNVERLLDRGYIDPEQAAAGKRFTDDYLIGVVGRTKSCLSSMVVVSGGAGYQTDGRHDAAVRFHGARDALDGRRSPLAIGLAPSALVLKCCLEEVAFSTLSVLIGASDEVAKARVAQALGVLGLHYHEVDRQSGRSSTPHTKQAVQRMLDPDLDEKTRQSSS